MKKLSISIVSDYICPWCFVGKRRLIQVINDLNLIDSIGLDLLPYRLYPNLPPSQKSTQYFSHKIKRDSLSRLADEGKTVGIDFQFNKITQLPNTIIAHEVVSSLGSDRRMVIADQIFSAHFEQGQDIADQEFLTSLLNSEERLHYRKNEAMIHQALSSSMDESVQRGIRAVPSFVINNDQIITGVFGKYRWARFLRKIG